MKKFIFFFLCFFLMSAYPSHSGSHFTLWADSIPAVSALSEDWFLDNIRAAAAYQHLTVSPSKEIIVAVIDTGVDYTHPDLAPAMWVNEAERNGLPGVDDDNNGYIDDIYGINTYDGNGDPMDTSKNTYQGHGTHIAGTILRTAGAIGSNPYNIKIMAIKAGSDYGSFSAGDVTEALEYAAAQGAAVINMSFGSDRIPAALKAALEEAAISAVLVAAAGNKGYPTSESGYPASLDIYPAGYPFVVGVMAHDSRNMVTGFSNWDYQPNTMTEYELSAPGVNIYAAFPDSSYQYMSGTSMATAVTSGAAALLCAKYSDTIVYSPASLSGHLMNARNSIAAYTDIYGTNHTFKRLDMVSLLSTEPVPDIVVTAVTISDAVSLSPLNNGNDQLNPGETITINFTLRNKQIDAKNISVTLSAPDGSYESHTAIDFLPALTDKSGGTFTVTLPQQAGISHLTLALTYENGCNSGDTTIYTGTFPVSLEITDSELKPPANVIPLQGITFAAVSPTVKAGTSQQLLLSFIPANTTDSMEIGFTSSNPTAATVDADGIVTARQKGTAVITVNVNRVFTASVTIYVTELPDPIPPEPTAPDPPPAAVVKPIALTAPVITTVSKKSPSAVVIGWNTIKNANGYELYRKTGANGTWKKIAAPKAGSVSFLDSTVKENKVYYYKMRAAGSGNYSASTFSSSKKIALPGKVTGFTIKKSKKLNFTWKKITAADGYEIYYRNPKNKTYQKWKTVKKNTLTITWNPKYKNYSFKVRAYTVSNGKKIYGSFSSARKGR